MRRSLFSVACVSCVAIVWCPAQTADVAAPPSGDSPGTQDALPQEGQQTDANQANPYGGDPSQGVSVNERTFSRAPSSCPRPTFLVIGSGDCPSGRTTVSRQV